MSVNLGKAGKVSIKMIHRIVDLIVLIIIIFLLAISVYALWDSNQVTNEAKLTQYAIYKPTENDKLSFSQLKNINEDVFGWLTIYGTSIDYPVVQGEDNERYVNTNVFGNYSVSGCLFLDYTNNKSFQDFSSIIYGHHMEDNVMFGDISSFGGKAFFDSHLYGNLYFDGKNHGLEIFAFIKTDAYDTSVYNTQIAKPDAKTEYFQNLLKKATFSRDITVTPDDHVVLLSTCSSYETNGRNILAAKITDDTYTNTFIEKETDAKPIKKTAGVSYDIFGDTSKLLIILSIILFLLLLALLFINMKSRKNRRSK